MQDPSENGTSREVATTRWTTDGRPQSGNFHAYLSRSMFGVV